MGSQSFTSALDHCHTCGRRRPLSAPWSTHWSILRCSPTSPFLHPSSDCVLDSPRSALENCATQWRQNPPAEETSPETLLVTLTSLVTCSHPYIGGPLSGEHNLLSWTGHQSLFYIINLKSVSAFRAYCCVSVTTVLRMDHRLSNFWSPAALWAETDQWWMG